MKYLRSIELLRAVYKVLYKGQRNLARTEQLQTVQCLMSTVNRELDLMLISLGQNKGQYGMIAEMMPAFKGTMEALNSVAVEVGAGLKADLTGACLTGDKDTALSLVEAIPDADVNLLSGLIDQKDIARILIYVDDLGNGASISQVYADALMDGVDSLIKILSTLFCKEYEEKNEIPTDENGNVPEHLKDVIRYAVARRMGLPHNYEENLV